MKKKKKKVTRCTHTELQGVLLLFFSLFWAFSLFSFVPKTPNANFLGYLGHLLAYFSLYGWGFTSYFLLATVAYASYKLILNQQPYKKKAVICLVTIGCSLCFLLTILSDTFPQQASFFTKWIAEKTHTVGSLTIRRYPLGGVPFYYFYKDLPQGNIEQLFSCFGAFFIFSCLFLISLMILSNTSLQDVLECYTTLAKKSIRHIKKRSSRKPSITKPLVRPVLPKQTPSLRPKFLPKKPEFFSKKPEENSKKTVPITSCYKGYVIPSARLLTNPKPVDLSSLKKGLAKQATILEKTLQSFQIEAKVGDIHCGPTITSFEVEPPIGVKVQKIKTLENDIALSMEAKSIRILAPIPGKAVVGIEVPSSMPQEVSFKEMLHHYQNNTQGYAIPIMLGKTVSGEYVSTDLTKMPHCLIAGATGSGKSVCINTIVMSILMNAAPDQVKLLMIDPKKVELSQYSCLPHMIAPVISEPHGAYAALQWLVGEMQLRYEILKQLRLRNIRAFNKRKRSLEQEESLPVPIPEYMPFIVAIVDEFADLMMVSSSDLETPIARIAQMARAVGIHLILATQRPSREVITGIIKANFPTRIAFKVSNRVNSQIILDETGAESLLGNGDLLFNPPGTSNLLRAQGAYISDEDIYAVIEQITKQAPAQYLIQSFDAMKKAEETKQGSDALYEKALEVILASRSASTTFLQRKLKIGYARAASLMDELEENGVVGPQEGAKPRKILKSHESFLA